MNEKTAYVLALIYHSIKRRRPEGTPYFRMQFVIIMNLLLHLIEVLAMVRTYLGINLVSSNRIIFISTACLIGLVLMFIIKTIYPLKLIANINVEQTHVNKMAVWSVIYTITNLLLYILISSL